MPVNDRLAVLKSHDGLDARIAAELDHHVQFDRVDMRKCVVVMLEVLGDIVLKAGHGLADIAGLIDVCCRLACAVGLIDARCRPGCAVTGSLKESVDSRQSFFPERVVRDIELLDRVFPRLVSDDDIEILALEDRTVIHLLRAHILHLMRQRFTNDHFQENAALMINIIQSLKESHQRLPLFRELLDRRCQEYFDRVHDCYSVCLALTFTLALGPSPLMPASPSIPNSFLPGFLSAFLISSFPNTDTLLFSAACSRELCPS